MFLFISCIIICVYSFDFGFIYSGDTEYLVQSADNPFKLSYAYLAGGGDQGSGTAWLIDYRINEVKKAGMSTFILTFYRLLRVSEENGCSGTEMEKVKCGLKNVNAMTTYYNDWKGFLEYLQTAKETYPDVEIIIHSEPDSWGFMWWAFGTEGEDDPSQIEVAVASCPSHSSDLSGFENNARGFSNALLHFAQSLAPDVKTAFHASNFRVGKHPTVVSNFINDIESNGRKWDLLFTEDAHWIYPEEDGNFYATPWGTEISAFQDNFNWLEQVTTLTNKNIYLWQGYPGPLDYNLLHEYPQDYHWIQELVNRNVLGVMWHLEASGGTVDDWRYYSAPPSGFEFAGGDGKSVVDRVKNFYGNPIDITPDPDEDDDSSSDDNDDSTVGDDDDTLENNGIEKKCGTVAFFVLLVLLFLF